ncbi:hypothetical protein chiPu_0002174 [Chiloscyllium punctatum]|uniref:Uncharacterized protein n=1 Tax=Chiloscyllium punctatum TaxID=137246 RepID=A0A401S068_CHIPU|nr:hypothetical protein [Chiloscyllium punctatum]
MCAPPHPPPALRRRRITGPESVVQGGSGYRSKTFFFNNDEVMPGNGTLAIVPGGYSHHWSKGELSHQGRLYVQKQ